MAVYHDAKCRICRRAGEKLFLKGERCYSTKCAVSRRAYPPGQKGKTGFMRLTEYGAELKEKQKIRRVYGILERQFVKYLNEAITQKGNTAEILLGILENRLDNVIYRSGLASSRGESRILVSHNHFMVNGKSVNIPSYRVKQGDIISIKESHKKKNYFKNVSGSFKKFQAPSWLSADKEKLAITVTASPVLEEIGQISDIRSVIEYYSR